MSALIFEVRMVLEAVVMNGLLCRKGERTPTVKQWNNSNFSLFRNVIQFALAHCGAPGYLFYRKPCLYPHAKCFTLCDAAIMFNFSTPAMMRALSMLSSPGYASVFKSCFSPPTISTPDRHLLFLFRTSLPFLRTIPSRSGDVLVPLH